MRRGGSGGPMAARGGALPGPPARPSGEQPTCGHRAQPRPRCSPSPGRPWLLCGFVARGLHRVRGAHRGRLPRTGALLLAAARWVALGCPASGTRGHGRVSLPRRVTGGPRCFSPPLPPLPPSPWSVTAAMPRAVCSARDFPSVRLEPRRRLPIPRSVTGTPLVALKPAGTAGIPAVPTHYERGCGGRHRAQLAEPPRPSSVPPPYPPLAVPRSRPLPRAPGRVPPPPFHPHLRLPLGSLCPSPRAAAPPGSVYPPCAPRLRAGPGSVQFQRRPHARVSDCPWGCRHRMGPDKGARGHRAMELQIRGSVCPYGYPTTLYFCGCSINWPQMLPVGIGKVGGNGESEAWEAGNP